MKNNSSRFDSASIPTPLSDSQPAQIGFPLIQSDAGVILSTMLAAKIGTELWRLKLKMRKMVHPGTEELTDEARRADRHLQAIWEALADAGIEIKDHTDQPYNAGFSLTVIAHQPVVGMSSETIIETIKPTIYYHHKQIQPGEVIVGVPENRPD